MRLTPALVLAVLLQAAPLAALTPDLPADATQTAAATRPLASYRLPTGPFDGKGVPARLVEGAVEARAWRIEGAGQTTLALMRALRAQVLAQGYAVIFECEAAACGGFDFRFATEVLPEPAMHVDLGDYSYLAAEKGGDVVSLIVSRSASAAFVQITQVQPVPAGAAPPPPAPDPAPAQPLAGGEDSGEDGGETEGETDRALPAPAPPGADTLGLIARLEARGTASLDDLRFAPGATALEAGDYASLAVLAGWLLADSGRQVVLVGHTDASGGLEANIAISRQRADEVRAVLVGRYDVPRGQVTAEGVGFLAPRASNATPEGQEANRRVEVVVIAGG
jgi:OOP family OmpA-OmpF porin